jgi:catechol 2,3-dioxygenase-like lactoylglutathione lyase family enzyme
VSPIVSSVQFVRDLERACAFYCDVLGFREIRDMTYDDAAAGAFLGRPAGSFVRYKLLCAGEGMLGMIGLFALASPTPPSVKRLDEGAHLGEAGLVFVCADLEALHARLEARGHPVLQRPATLHNPDGSSNREMTFRDLDGVMINVMERRSGG